MHLPPQQQNPQTQHSSPCSDPEALCRILDAFPNRDIEGHRLYHESIISRNRDIGEFFKKLTFELAKWGLIGLISFLIYAAWTKFLQGPFK